jgi:enterochelin esterase-like enzyme
VTASVITDWTTDDDTVESEIIGRPWRLLVQRPADRSLAGRMPWLWLLHGRTASIEDMRAVLAAAAEAMAHAEVPPMVIVAPDAPEGHRTSWWVDSGYEPPEGSSVERGLRLETALLDDVRPAVEAAYGVDLGPEERSIGGISMGGGAALRFLIVRPDLFGAAVLLSPAVFEALPVDPPGRTVARDVEAEVFQRARYAEVLHYPTLLEAVEPQRPVARVITVVGDGEPVREDAAGRHDLELEASRLHATLKRHPAYDSSLRVVGGGHTWPMWQRGVVTALQVLSGRDG